MTGLALAGRVAVVVGGTSGIGLALFQALAAAGADALDRAALETALSETMAAFSRLDILGASEPRCA
jgi:NAD(P)-dependent dehydrogenase (short-subunit alcohol dehydrogenase family)